MTKNHTETRNHLPMGEMDSASVDLVNKINVLLNETPSGGDLMADTRDVASKIFTTFAGPDNYKDVETKDITFPGLETEIPARLYFHPKNNFDPCAAVIFFHGGGWALGGLDDYDVLLKSITAQSMATIISVDYRLAPEHPFPHGLNDAQLSFDYVQTHARDFKIDPTRIAVMGDSAGGNLAAVLAQSPKNKGEIVAQFLLYPMLDVHSSHATYPSRLAYGDGAHFLTRAAIDKSVEDYTGGIQPLNNPRISPLSASSLNDVPPTYIMVGDCDPLRDESFAYANRLTQVGIDVKIDCIPGAIHGFLSFGCLEDVQLYRTKLAQNIQRRLTRT